MLSAEAQSVRTRRTIGVLLAVWATFGWDPLGETLLQLTRGFTLPDLAIAAVAVGLLVGVLTHLARGGAAAWSTRERRRDSLRALVANVVVAGALGGYIVTLAYVNTLYYTPYRTYGLLSEPYSLTMLLAARGIVGACALGLILGRPLRGRSLWVQLGALSLPALGFLLVESGGPTSWSLLSAAVGVPVVLYAVFVPRARPVPSTRWLHAERLDAVELRLGGFTATTIFRFLRALVAASTWFVVGVVLLSLGFGIDADLVKNGWGELRVGAGVSLVWTGLFLAQQATVRLLLRWWRPTPVTLTPTGARVGHKRVEGRNLVLDVVEDDDGTMLVVGDGIVLATDTDREALEAVIARVRRHLVRESDADAERARQALGTLAAREATHSQIWLEPSRRAAALANLIPPAVLAIGLFPMVMLDATPTSMALVFIPTVFTLRSARRIWRLSRAARSREQEAEQDGDAVAEAPHQSDKRERATRSHRVEQ